MTIRCERVTPITAGAFLLSAVTGMLIFFHADSGAKKFVHEWLSWVLLAGAGLHVAVNLPAASDRQSLADLMGPDTPSSDPGARHPSAAGQVSG